MNHRLPDLRLLHTFGNEDVFLEKVSGLGSLAARLAIGIIGADRSFDAQRREEMLRAQAARMNQAFRVLENAKMFPVRESARHTRVPMVLMPFRAENDASSGLGLGPALHGVPRELAGEDVPLGMDEGMVRLASAIGQDLAMYALDKEAGIGTVVSGGLKRFGTGLKNVRYKLSPNARFQHAVKEMGLAEPPKPGLFSRIHRKISPTARLQHAAKELDTAVKPPTTPHLETPHGTGVKPPTTPRVESPGKPPPPPSPEHSQPYRTQAAPPGGAPSPGQVTQEVKPSEPQAASGTGEASEGGFDLDKFWKRTGLSEGRWKWKLPLLAAGVLGARALYSGAQKGFELLSREPGPYRYNEGGAVPAYGVNQYGVPDRSMPFT